MTEETIGKILQERRNELGLSQRQIATALGYKNYNYISMVETGRTTIPRTKIPEILAAYNLDPAFGPTILKATYPEIWEMAVGILKPMADELVQGREELSARIENVASELKKKYRC